jgi:predicted alpha/beta hydrolase
MLDWASQGWTGRYEPKAAGIDYEALLGQATFPVLSISFSDDGYCPEAACRHLAQKMRSSRLTFHNYTPDSLNEEWIGHFGWVKKSYILRAPIRNWVESVLNRVA